MRTIQIQCSLCWRGACGSEMVVHNWHPRSALAQPWGSCSLLKILTPPTPPQSASSLLHLVSTYRCDIATLRSPIPWLLKPSLHLQKTTLLWSRALSRDLSQSLAVYQMQSLRRSLHVSKDEGVILLQRVHLKLPISTIRSAYMQDQYSQLVRLSVSRRLSILINKIFGVCDLL